MILSARVAFPVVIAILVALFLLTTSNPGVSQKASAADSSTQEVPVDWDHLPSGLEPGDSFRLLFVTSDSRDAQAKNISDYNAFVQSAAARNDNFEGFSGDFRALASVSGVHAIDNSGTRGTGVPIYWVDGAKVANDYADLYDGSWASRAGTDENGTLLTGRVDIWTGTKSDGTQHAAELGNGRTFVAVYTRLDMRSPFGMSIVSTTDKKRLYALSPVLQVALGQAAATPVPADEDDQPPDRRIPTPEPTLTVVWTATLTADFADGEAGCSNARSFMDDCSTALTDDEFTYGGITYKISRLLQTGALHLNFDAQSGPDAKTALGALKLSVDGRKLAFSSATVHEPLAGASGLYWWPFSSTWTDGQKVSLSLTEASTPEPNHDPAGAPTISGTAQVGRTLTADTSGISDPDGLTNVRYGYQWLAGEAEIYGATGSTYKVRAEDKDKTIQVRVRFIDDEGHTQSLTSAPTAAVVMGGL